MKHWWVSVFPAILVILNLGMATSYFWNGDWKRGTYWILCAGCNIILAL